MSASDAPGLAPKVATAALEKARANGERLTGVLADLLALIRLVRAWTTGRYRAIPWRSILMAGGAVVYFLDPLDAIPDWIPGIGYVDDAAMIAFVAGAIKSDLQRFVEWERSLRTR